MRRCKAYDKEVSDDISRANSTTQNFERKTLLKRMKMGNFMTQAYLTVREILFFCFISDKDIAE